MEGDVFHLGSSLHWSERTREGLQRRTALGMSVGCGGQRDCQFSHRRWRSPTDRGQTPTGKLFRLRGM